MSDFLKRLSRDPYAPIDGASVVSVDELGNGYDYRGQLIAPKFEEPQQTWGETALGVATAPARMATALAGSLSPYGQDGWQVPPLVSEGVDALTAVGDAYNYGMDNEETQRRALGMAGFMMGGGGLAARPAGSTGMFAGRLANTADHEALARAERLAAEGADRRAIWDQTGWYQGPDSKWRFEIDDSKSQFTIPQQERHTLQGQPIEGSAAFVYRHPDLWNAYPDEARLPVSIGRNDGQPFKGFYDGSQIGGEAGTTGAARELMLHETQHALQRKEGFARGGNRGMFGPDEIAAERARVDTPDPNDWSGIGGGYGDAPDTDVALGLYKRLAGETEARNVQTRMNMSADQRRATPPWETQDIPDIDQIVRLYSNASKEGALPALLDMGQSASVQRHPVFGHEMPLANNNPLTFEMQLSKIASGESDLPMGGDFYQAARDIQAAEVNDLAAAFGGDTRKAKEFLRLLNDDNPSTAHKFEALQAEAKDVPERVYADRFIYDDLARTFDDLERNPTEYAEIVNRFLADIPTGGKNPASWTSKEQAAMAVMRKAVQEGSRVGVAPDTFSRTVASNYARQFRDPQDAEFMLNELSSSLRQVKKLAANADSRPALLGAGQEQIEDGYADGGSVSLPGPYSVAKSMIGQREGRGNDLLNRFLNGDTSGMTSAEYAWCSRFVKQSAAKAGVDVSKATDMARSWLDVGQPVDKPDVGDVVVLSRGNPNSQYGHVGFYEGTDANGNVRILSGNHNNAVASGSYPASRVLGYRRLDGQPEAYDPATGQQGLKPLAMMDGVGRELPALPTQTPEPSTQVAETPKSSFDFTKLASLFAEPEQAQAPQVNFTPIQSFQSQGSPIEASTPYRGTFAHGGQVRGLPDQSEPIHAGPLHSTVPGRTDHLPITVAAGSFVLPADIVSSLGEGNTNAGMEAVSKMFPLPPVRRADGGRVPIAAAGGEYVISPETVAAIAGGNIEAGHELLDQFVRRTRAQNIQRLRALPGPEK